MPTRRSPIRTKTCLPSLDVPASHRIHKCEGSRRPREARIDREPAGDRSVELSAVDHECQALRENTSDRTRARIGSETKVPRIVPLREQLPVEALSGFLGNPLPLSVIGAPGSIEELGELPAVSLVCTDFDRQTAFPILYCHQRRLNNRRSAWLRERARIYKAHVNIPPNPGEGRVRYLAADRMSNRCPSTHVTHRAVPSVLKA